MSDLKEVLLGKIAAGGPVTVADYMGECLLHPKHGYYTTRTPFGAAGDFTTAPEISQMFGELLGLCLAQTWIDQGRPDGFSLAELGPGRGTLMADILRVTKMVPGFHDAMDVVLLEASPALRETQKEQLTGYDVTWIDAIDELAQQPLFLIANEFIDALPVRQFSRDGAGWREHMITDKGDKLAMALAGAVPVAALEQRISDTKSGDTVEIRPMVVGFVQPVAARIAAHGGAAIFIDYGDWRSLGDTFQAVKDHKAVSPLAEPGQADLTAHVDFEALSQAADTVSVTSMTLQRDLLNRLGIETRAQQLGAGLEGDELEAHDEALRRLTHPQEMGKLFKAIALFQNGAPPPPGFET
ncbi:MAG: SAM-dependent methyltransferase [Paracoccaceae bacterium]